MQITNRNQAPRRHPRKRFDSAGFTLVEVMVATVILTIVFVSSVTTVQKGFEILEAARNISVADQILQSDLEDIRLCSWSKLSTLQPPQVPAALASRFTATRVVTDEANRNSNMKRIRITVSWQTTYGRTFSRSYETLFTRYGLNDYFVTNRS